jgi:hypothetical protein
VRERGPRTRRVQPGRPEPAPHGPPTGSSRANGWQIVAIIALIVATAGWTTAILLATRDTDTPIAAASPTESIEPEPSDDETLPPVADTHDAPELEARLPRELQGTALQVQSWTGVGILSDDNFSTSVTSFLACVGKTPDDLRVAQAYDPDQAIDGSIGIYQVDGVAPAEVRDALLAAWKVDSPDMTVSTVKLAGQDVTKADFGEDTIDSWLVVRDGVVYDIETNDQDVAAAAVAALPAPGAAPSGSSRPAPPSGGSHAPIVCPSPSASPAASAG